MPGINDFLKFNPSPLTIKSPALAELEFDAKDVRLPAIISTRNAWNYDGHIPTPPQFSENLPDVQDAVLRPELDPETAPKNVIYDYIDVRKPEFQVYLPDEHTEIGIHIKQATFSSLIDLCHMQ